MVATHIKKLINNVVTVVCPSEIIYIFLVDQLSGFVENFNIGIFSDTIIVIKIKLCMMILNIELYLFITLSMTLTLKSQQCPIVLTENLMFYLIKLKVCRIVKYIKQVMNIFEARIQGR